MQQLRLANSCACRRLQRVHTCSAVCCCRSSRMSCRFSLTCACVSFKCPTCDSMIAMM